MTAQTPQNDTTLWDRLRPGLFGLIVAAQLAVLGYMVYHREHLLAEGKSVLLQCEPVDPRSLLSGDYVILRYTITRLSGQEIVDANIFQESFQTNQTMYVALAPLSEAEIQASQNTVDRQPLLPGTYRAVAIARDLERLRAARPDAIILRGTALNDVQATGPQNAELAQYTTLDIRYGVEQYFVPQFEGHTIENEIARTTVEVAVADSGESAIRKLFIDGKEVRFQ